MKRFIKTTAQRLGIYRQVSDAWIWLSPLLTRASRVVTNRDRSLIDRYLASHPVARLQIGCGGNELSDWLNTDLNPGSHQVRLDATKPFPFGDASFDAIYSEHMIEHVPWQGGRAMLSECYRVLKPGGILRVVTPDFGFLMRLMQAPGTPEHSAYIAYSMKEYGIAGPAGSATHVVNHFVRAWGHQFIYDEATLRGLMGDCGFTAITACELNTSSSPALAGLAKDERMPEGFLSMESLILEGRKSAR